MSAKARLPVLPKVVPPRLGRVLPRAAVAHDLLAAVREGAAWVQAPGGSGKTTAVAAIAADLKCPVAWLHADPGDAQLQSFFHYLGLAVTGALPRATGALPVYGAELETEAELYARRFARAALESGAGRDVVLVIDNLQDIDPESRVHAVIAAICDEMAGAWKVFLVTRDPPGVAYARLLGEGRLSRIAAERLAFSESETKEALRLRGILDERRLEALWRQSRGWIAGALLLAMVPESEAAPVQGAGADSAGLFPYFASQAFSRLAAQDRRLLILTSFLVTVRPQAAVALSGLADAERRLDSLAVRGTFVMRLGAAPARFRYHDMFRDFLRAQAVERESAAEIRRLKRATAVHLVADDEALAAVELLAECEDWAGVRAVVIEQAERILDQGKFRALADLIGRVPAAEREGDPWLAYWLAQCRAGSSDSEAVDCLIRSHDLFARRGDRAGQLIAGIGVPVLMRNQIRYNFDYRAWIAAIEELAGEAPAIDSPFLALKVSAGLMSLVPLSPRLAQGTDAIVERILALVTRVEDPNARLQALTQVVGMAWRMRRGAVVPPVVAVVENQRLEDSASPLLVLHWLYDLMAFDTMYGSAQRSIECADRCLQIALATGLPIARYEALLCKLEITSDRNDVGASLRLLEELSRHVDPSRPATLAWSHGFRARVALIEDAPEKALAEFHAGMEIMRAAKMPMAYSQAFFAMEAGALALQGRYEEALESCRRWRGIFIEPHKAVADVYEAWIVAAAALDSGSPDARRLLTQAVALARQCDYPVALRHANRLSARLCAKALEWGIDPDFIAGVIARRNLEAPDPESASWPWPVRVRCMGPFEILRKRETVAARGRSQKTVELLQVAIALGGNAPLERLIPILWPGEGRVGARHALETALYRLRKLLGSDSCVAISDRRLVLDRRQIWVDALALNAVLARFEARGEAPDDEAIGTLADLHAEPFLPARAREPWAVDFRGRLWTRVRRLMVAAARRARETGQPERAERLLFWVIDRHAVAEDAFAELMRLYLGLGQPAEALHAYRRCAAALSAEMKLEPGEELGDLAAGIEARYSRQAPP